MATIGLIHKRVGNDIKIALALTDGGVAVDWTTVEKVRAFLTSDQQRVKMGDCRIGGPDIEDPTKLLMQYPAAQPEYLGVARLVVTVTYHGHVSTFDTPLLVFVPSTAEEGTGTVEVEAPVALDPENNNLEISVTDVDTSVLEEAISEAQAAADAANEAAEKAGVAINKLRGGTTDQVLTKNSDEDGDYEWRDPQGGTGGMDIHALTAENDLADADEVPFYDASAEGNRKTVWSNIKAKLKAYFDTIYSTFSGAWGSLTGNIANQTDLKDALDAKQNVINDLSDIRSGATAGATAYQKPGSGIPKTDMASAVQTSLGKADTALQPADITTLEGKVEAIEGKIPTEASSSNQLADKNFVNSSISTATATFKGTYNLVSDLLLTTSATTAQIAAALASAITGEDNNDYAFVQIPTADATPTEISRVDRYKFDGTDWAFEFSLNNSSFTAAQWAAINSGITPALVAAFSAKYDKPSAGIPASDLAPGVIPPPPTVDQTYDATSTNAQSGVAMAGALATKANSSDIPDAVEANPTVPSGTTPTALNNLKVGDDYYSVPQGGDSAPVLTTETYQYIPRPKYAEIWFTGTLPTDTSDTRTPTSLSFEMKVGGKAVLAANCELSIQGHGSTAYAKKGYTFDILNTNGDSASLKFGDLPAADSFHLKAYATDMTHTRGLAGAKIWRQMLDILPYQENLVTNRALSLVATQKKNALYWADAKFSEDGFPCAFYLNGSFHGLYTLKLKKGKPNYALNDSDTDNIFLDAASSNYTAYLSQSFDYSDWELKSPKITGYTPNGQITDAGVLADIQSLWAFTTDLSNKYTQHADYIVLNHWLLWYILCELVCHKDTSGNNYELLTWDGIHWSILPYDMDLTLGLDAWASYTIQTAVTGWQVGTQPNSGDTSFWANFRTLYRGELSTLYTLLRRSVLTIDNLSSIFKGEAECIPRDIYDADYQAWGTIWNNGLPTLQQTLAVLESRLAFLDGEWLTPDKQPIAGMQPGIKYDLGTLSGAVTFKVASPLVAALGNRYDFAFDSGSTAAVPTWPAGLAWSGNCLDQDGVPEIAASKHYEVSIEDGYGNITEYGPAVTPPTPPTPYTPLEDLTARIWMGHYTYCQTDIVPDNTDYIKIKFALSDLSNGYSKELVGYRKYSNSDEDSFILELDSYGLGYMGLKVKIAGTYWASALAPTDDTRYVVEAKASGVTCSPSLGTFTRSSYTYSQAGALALGGLAFSDNTVGMAYDGKAIFGVEIYGSDDTLKHRLIPQSDLTFLDEVTNTSYAITGSNAVYNDD